MPHDLTIKTAPLPVKPTGTLVIYAADGGQPDGLGAEIWAATGLDWGKVSTAAGFKGKQGQVLDIIAPRGVDAERLLVLGSGKPADSDGAPTTPGPIAVDRSPASSSASRPKGRQLFLMGRT